MSLPEMPAVPVGVLLDVTQCWKHKGRVSYACFSLFPTLQTVEKSLYHYELFKSCKKMPVLFSSQNGCWQMSWYFFLQWRC